MKAHRKLDSQTVSADKLCQLTGLTDKRHRQLAKAGYFPPPYRADYQLIATIQGMFKYYREQAQAGTPIDAKKLEKLTQETALLDVELARARNEVIEVETVFRVWESVAMSIRRTILMSPLSDKEKDSILKELQSVKAENYMEQRKHDQGVDSPILRDVPAAGKNQQEPVGGTLSAA